MPDSLSPAACPVCQWPQPEVAICGRCGTILRGGYVVGLPTREDESEYAALLAAEQRHHDLRAAVLAAVVRRDSDHVLLETMARFCRGGSIGASAEQEIERLIAEVSRTQEESTVGIGFALARLVAGETAAIQFMEIGPDGIAVEQLAGQPNGVPQRVPGTVTPWHDLVHELPGEAALRRFRLAGGIGTGWSGNPEALADAVRDAAARAATTLLRDASAAIGEDAGSWGAPTARLDYVLVLRSPEWPLLKGAARRVRGILQPVAEIVDLGADPLHRVVDAIARRAPLRHEYALALAARGPRGTVQLDPYPLFRAGTVIQRHDVPHAGLPVRAIFPGARQLVLPVLARLGAEQADWQEVGRAIVDARNGATVNVRVRLEGPGAVKFLAPAALRDDGSLPRWPDLLGELPRRIPDGMAADVVVLVECGSDAGQARARLDLLDRVLGAVGHGDLRVAVVGYRDHLVEMSPVVSGSFLDTVERARAMSARLRAWEPDRWDPGRTGDDHAAPLEDALDWVATRNMGWRPRARHLLVAIARRPPHPTDREDGPPTMALKCKVDWEETLVTLRKEQDVECFAVVPATSAPRDDDTDHAWRMIGAAGFIDMQTTSAEQLVQVMHLVPGRGTQWCLAERADGGR